MMRKPSTSSPHNAHLFLPLCFIILIFLGGSLLSPVAAEIQHYKLDYVSNGDSGWVEVDQLTNTALVSPPNAAHPETLVDFTKSVTVYIVSGECFLYNDPPRGHPRTSRDRSSERASGASSPQILYVSHRIPQHQVQQQIGDRFWKWCQQNPTWQLTSKQPNLPSYSAYLRSYAANQTAAQTSISNLERKKRSLSEQRRHQRRGRGKKGRGRSKGRKGRPNRERRVKHFKRPLTKSLEGNDHSGGGGPPRIDFPSVFIPQRISDDATVSPEAPEGTVVLQEEPYPLPSFVRGEDNGQGFRHYRDFYHDTNITTSSHENMGLSSLTSSSSSSPSSSAAAAASSLSSSLSSSSASFPSFSSSSLLDQTKSDIRNSKQRQQLSFQIPETIVKDGQVFYRHDENDDIVGDFNHQDYSNQIDDSDYNLDDGEQSISDDYNHLQHYKLSTTAAPLTFDVQGVENNEAKHSRFLDGDISLISEDTNLFPRSSHVHSQAQMGSDLHEASAGSLAGSGPATQVQGSASHGGYFSALAQMSNHGGGLSHAQVQGNMHGVQGTAITHNNGYQSQAEVQMGPHSSSSAQVTHGDNTQLTSSVHATQFGGSANAQMHGEGSSDTYAQMEFNPVQHYHASNGLRGQGAASVLMTPSGSSSLASLAGDVSGGRYLGRAFASLSHQLADGASAIQQLYEGAYSDNEDRERSIQNHRQNEDTHINSSHDEIDNNSTIADIYEWQNLFSSDSNDSQSNGTPTSHAQNRTENVFPVHQEDGKAVLQESLHHDMLGNIMEMVLQPHIDPDASAYSDRQFPYSANDHVIIDQEGLTGGAGVPPRESEIEQTPLHIYEERTGTSQSRSSDNGQVGLATYSHGSLGAPPRPGELLEPQVYAYGDDYYSYDTDYYADYEDGIGPSQPPYFDLRNDYFSLEPIELNYETFPPAPTVTLPMTPSSTPQPVMSSKPLSSHPNSFSTTSDAQFTDQTSAFSPDPPILVHHVQTSTPQLPTSFQPHTLNQPETPLPQQYIPEPHVSPPHSHVPIQPSLSDTDLQNTIHHSSTSHLQVQPISGSQNGADKERVNASETNGDSVMLQPVSPGSILTLPGTHGGPTVKVMTIPASGNTQSISLLRQRLGTPIQPGEEVPGAPGYHVPPGFRGRVYLGQELPVSGSSRRVVEGFKTHFRLSPQNPVADDPVYASVSGPEASQYLSSGDTATTGVHVTLSGGGKHTQDSGSLSHTSGSMPGINPIQPHHQAMRTAQGEAHSARLTQQQPQIPIYDSETSQSVSRGTVPSHSSRSDSDTRNSWQNNGRGNINEDPSSCGYYSQDCNIVYDLNQQKQICRPIFIAMVCCC